MYQIISFVWVLIVTAIFSFISFMVAFASLGLSQTKLILIIILLFGINIVCIWFGPHLIKELHFVWWHYLLSIVLFLGVLLLVAL